MNNLNGVQDEPTVTYVPAIDYSGFEKGWIITDLVFCGIRLIIVILGVIIFAAVTADNSIYRTSIFEILTGIGVAGFGIAADILLLRKNPPGLMLAYMALLFVFLNIAVTVWQLMIKLEQMDSSAKIFGVLGFGVVVLIRVALNVVYVFVLNSVRKKLATR